MSDLLRDPDLRDPSQVARHLREFQGVAAFPTRTLVCVLTDDDGLPLVHPVVGDVPRVLLDDECERWLWVLTEGSQGRGGVLLGLVERGRPTEPATVQRLRAAGERGCALSGNTFLGLYVLDLDGTTVRHVPADPTVDPDLADVWQPGGDEPVRVP